MRNAGRKLAFLTHNQTFSKQIVSVATRVILFHKITSPPVDNPLFSCGKPRNCFALVGAATCRPSTPSSDAPSNCRLSNTLVGEGLDPPEIYRLRICRFRKKSPTYPHKNKHVLGCYIAGGSRPSPTKPPDKPKFAPRSRFGRYPKVLRILPDSQSRIGRGAFPARCHPDQAEGAWRDLHRFRCFSKGK